MWDIIKKVLQKHKGACIIVEDGKPAFVVTSFDEYENLLDKDLPAAEKFSSGASEQELIEKINQEIADWKTAQAEQQAAQELAEDQEVKIEDLPI